MTSSQQLALNHSVNDSNKMKSLPGIELKSRDLPKHSAYGIYPKSTNRNRPISLKARAVNALKLQRSLSEKKIGLPGIQKKATFCYSDDPRDPLIAQFEFEGKPKSALASLGRMDAAKRSKDLSWKSPSFSSVLESSKVINEGSSSVYPVTEGNPIHHYLQSLVPPVELSIHGSMSTTGSRAKEEMKYDPALEELRTYTVLMERYGLNQFLIYRGATLSSTPEFESYRNTFNHDWGAITGVIKELEGYLKSQEVKLAIIDGIRLHEIASFNLPTIHKEDLISCISNIDEIRACVFVTKAVPSIEQENRAAIKIQAMIRGAYGFKHYQQSRHRLLAAILIQSRVRTRISCNRMKDKYATFRARIDTVWADNVEKLKRRWLPKDDSSNKMSILKNLNFQSEACLSKSTSDSLINDMKVIPKTSEPKDLSRLVIIIPSISIAEYIRLQISNIHQVQNMHIAALYQLVDPYLHIVYVTPISITAEEMAYHERFFRLLGVDIYTGEGHKSNVTPHNSVKRLHYVVPEMVNRLPSHMSLAQVLFYSTMAVKKIKNFIKKHDDCTLIPCTLSGYEKKISNLLNVPMLSPDPSVGGKIGSRSIMKKVFIDVNVNIPIGAHDISTTSDFYAALSALVTSNIQVTRWLFKCNIDYNNESYAYIDIDSLSVMRTLRAEMAALVSANKNNASAWYSKQVQLDVRKRVLTSLKAEFRNKVVICRPDTYGDTWDKYEQHIKQHGMVIEAHPLNLSGYVYGLCFVDANGVVETSVGVDVFVDENYQVQGFIGPQSHIPNTALQSVTKVIADSLYSKYGVIGYLSVEYQATWDDLENRPCISALGVKCGLSNAFVGSGAATVSSEKNPMTNFNPISLVSKLGGSPQGLLPPLTTTQARKYYVYIPYAYHRPLSCTTAFFKFCKMRMISFDSNKRTGVLFFPIGSIQGGAISALCIENSRKQAIESAARMLRFVIDQYGNDTKQKIESWESFTSILKNLEILYDKEFRNR
mmetsp:Transcript_34142/g.32567  ORF Transcript_34142/g.32567 Transcript_34142/m.32567 type:complete len:993 (-) Transcript_34142:38-3016(-)